MQAVSAIELRPRFDRWRYARPGDVQELTGRARRDDALAGEARPGDVLALAGGALVRDANANGRVDGADGRVDELVSTPVRTRGILLDVRG